MFLNVLKFFILFDISSSLFLNYSNHLSGYLLWIFLKVHQGYNIHVVFVVLFSSLSILNFSTV